MCNYTSSPRRNERKGEDMIFEDIMADNFTHLMKILNPQIQEVQ